MHEELPGISLPRLWVTLCSVFFVLIALLACLTMRHFLFERYAFTDASVTRVEPHDHARVYYSYRVGAQTFASNQSFRIVERGAHLKVFYPLYDPSVSTLEDPSSGLPGVLVPSFFGAAFAASCVTLQIALAGKKLSPWLQRHMPFLTCPR